VACSHHHERRALSSIEVLTTHVSLEAPHWAGKRRYPFGLIEAIATHLVATATHPFEGMVLHHLFEGTVLHHLFEGIVAHPSAGKVLYLSDLEVLTHLLLSSAIPIYL
jgi:hypothetical protein